MPRQTVIIADDHALIRQGIQQIMETARLDVIAEAADGLEAIALVRKHRPDLLVLDIAMPYARGIEVFGEVKRWSPDTKVIVFSGMTSSGLIGELANAGVDATFLKRENLDAFSESILHVLRGQRILGPGVAELLEANQQSTELTVRERQVLSMIAQGLSNRDIAMRFGVSLKTVDNHRTNLMRKLNAHSAGELLAHATREGLLETNSQI